MIKKKIIIFPLLILLFNFLNTENIEANKNIEKEEVIVIYKDKDLAKQTFTNLNSNVIKDFKNITASTIEIPKHAINNLKNNPNVLSVEKNQIISLSSNFKVKAENTVSIQSQQIDWGLKRIKLNQEEEPKITGNGVKIAVVDSGIEYYHSDLKVVDGVSFVQENLSNGTIDYSYDDYLGHGTHVAGIISSQDNSLGTLGIAPNAEIYAVKVFDASGESELSTLIEGIDWSITNKMDIINLSLGSSSGSLALKEIIEKAASEDILVVASAGNDGYTEITDDTVSYPAYYDYAIAVAATDKDDNLASFSSIGPSVEVSAPGVDILSTYLLGEYAYMSGTSMAAPYVTGLLALLKEINPEASNAKLRELLINKSIDLGSEGRDNFFGYGLVQINTETEDFIIKPPTETIDNYITFLDRQYLYSEANEKSKTNTSLSPQTVYAIEKQSDWIKIKTWLGERWIKPNFYVNGKIEYGIEKITLEERVVLHNLPEENNFTNSTVSPQIVLVNKKIGDWYEINTWLGSMWIKPTQFYEGEVYPYEDFIELQERTLVYTKTNRYYRTGSSLSPQTVYAKRKSGDWYLINTWLGEKWVKPIIGEMEVLNTNIETTERVKLYQEPFLDTSLGATISPQTVFALRKWNNWFEINSWLGPVWIKIE